MRLIADQGFPASIEAYRSLDVSFHRWIAEPLHDLDLMRTAQLDGFQGVLFLGQQVLASGRVLERAKELELYVLATHDADPVDALRAVANNLNSIERLASAGIVHVLYTNTLRELEPGAESKA